MSHKTRILRERVKRWLLQHCNKSNKGFTLVELLIVIGILATLATAVVVVINPVEILRQGRDSTRMREIGAIHGALSMFQVDRPTVSMGFANTIYISIPDTSSTCTNLSLPTPPTGWSYRCVTTANLRRIDGYGWIPVDLTTIFQGSPLSHLPIDPINIVASNNFYAYVTDGRTWTLVSLIESERYIPSAIRDGGTDYARFEAGSNLALWTNASGLVGYWSFDEGSGTTVNDLSGRGNVGTLQNGPTWTTGRVGGALSFDGVNDLVSVLDSASLNITGTITIEAWIKTTSASVDFSSTIITKGSGAYFLTTGEYTFTTPRVTGFLWIGGAWHFLRGNTPINDGNWHHAVMTYNGSHLKVYRNGILDAVPRAVSGAIGVDSRPLNIGRYLGTSSLFFRGSIDEVRIYNRALSATEIMASFNATR